MPGGWVPTPVHFGSGTPLPVGPGRLSDRRMVETSLHPSAVSAEPGAPVVVLGVAFDPMTLEGAVDRIEQMVASIPGTPRDSHSGATCTKL